MRPSGEAGRAMKAGLHRRGNGRSREALESLEMGQRPGLPRAFRNGATIATIALSRPPDSAHLCPGETDIMRLNRIVLGLLLGLVPMSGPRLLGRRRESCR